MTEFIHLVAALFVLAGSFFCLSAAVGVVRFPDVITRLHSATKPQVFGLVLILTGVGLRMWEWKVTTVALLIVAFQILTAPVSAHMVSRTAYRLGLWDAEDALVDELGEDLEEAGFTHPADLDEGGHGVRSSYRWKPAQGWLPPSVEPARGASMKTSDEPPPGSATADEQRAAADHADSSGGAVTDPGHDSDEAERPGEARD